MRMSSRACALALCLLVGSVLGRDYPRPCSQTSCVAGKCVWEDCEEEVNCEGGNCIFRGCRSPRCHGGLCDFYDSHDATCDGGGCHFIRPQTTLRDGYCAGGKCKVDGVDWDHTMADRLTY